MKQYLLEICANSVQSAQNAQSGGAHRVELCSNLDIGGTTPSAGMIIEARKHLSIDFYVLIRPRAGGFCYTKVEIAEMIRDIEFCAVNGVNGVVIGCLTPDNAIDWEAIKFLAEAAGKMALTFHRAFDFVSNPIEQLAPLGALNFENILTTGAADKAIDGLSNIAQYIEHDQNIHIMPGGGVNASNILAFAQAGATRFHLSGKKIIPSHEAIPIAFGAQYETDTSTVKKIKSILDNYFV